MADLTLSSGIARNFHSTIVSIVNGEIEKAGMTKTVKATIETPKNNGEYVVVYTGGRRVAKNINPDTAYSVGDNVWITLTDNEAIIIGSAERLGDSYNDATYVVEDIENYNILGEDCLIDKTNSQFIVGTSLNFTLVPWYQKEESNNDFLDVDNEKLKELLANAGVDGIYVNVLVSTNFSEKQTTSVGGNYGLAIRANFEADKEGQTELYTKEFRFGLEDFVGNPYNLNDGILQGKFFEIAKPEEFKEISGIYVYCEGFPTEESTFVSFKNLTIKPAASLTEEDRKEYAITFSTPKGNGFGIKSNLNSEIVIEPVFRHLGIPVDYTSQLVNFYWFKEDALVTSKNTEYYNKYGGPGWRCLNPSTIGDNAAEWAPYEGSTGEQDFIIQEKDVINEKQIYKCVAVYDGKTYSKTIEIFNLRAKKTIDILTENSSNLIEFDDKLTQLSCVVRDGSGEDITNKYYYTWGYEDYSNHFVNLNEYYGKENMFSDIVKNMYSSYNNDKDITLTSDKNNKATTEDSNIDIGTCLEIAKLTLDGSFTEIVEKFIELPYDSLNTKEELKFLCLGILDVKLNSDKSLKDKINNRIKLINKAYEVAINEDYIELTSPIDITITTSTEDITSSPLPIKQKINYEENNILPEWIYNLVFHYAVGNINTNKYYEFNEGLEFRENYLFKEVERYITSLTKVTLQSEFNFGVFLKILKKYVNIKLTSNKKQMILSELENKKTEYYNYLDDLKEENILSKNDYENKKNTIDNWYNKCESFIKGKEINTTYTNYNLSDNTLVYGKLFTSYEVAEEYLYTHFARTKRLRLDFITRLQAEKLPRESLITTLYYTSGIPYYVHYTILKFLHHIKNKEENETIEKISENYFNISITKYINDYNLEKSLSGLGEKGKTYEDYCETIKKLLASMKGLDLLTLGEYGSDSSVITNQSKEGRLRQISWFNNHVESIYSSDDDIPFKNNSNIVFDFVSLSYDECKNRVDAIANVAAPLLNNIEYNWIDNKSAYYEYINNTFNSVNEFFEKKNWTSILNEQISIIEDLVKNTRTESIKYIIFPKKFLETVFNYSHYSEKFNNLINNFNGYCNSEILKDNIKKIYSAILKEKKYNNILYRVLEDYSDNSIDLLNPMRGFAASSNINTTSMYLRALSINEKDTYKEIKDEEVIQIFFNALGYNNIDDDKLIEENIKNINIFFNNKKNNISSTIQYIKRIYGPRDNIVLDLKTVPGPAVFSCSVYTEEGELVGTKSIKLIDSATSATRTINIKGGNQIFKYTDEGNSPTSLVNLQPQEVLPLSIQIIDNEKGIDITNSVTFKDIRWTIPTSNTLIKTSTVYGKNGEELKNGVIEGPELINFDIVDQYDFNCNNNQISVSALVYGERIVATTNLSFLKNGDNGTNGTENYLRITPTESKSLYNAMILQEEGEEFTLSFDNTNTNIPYEWTYYRHGVPVVSSSSEIETIEKHNIENKLTVSVVQNIYDKTNEDLDKVLLEIEEDSFGIKLVPEILPLTKEKLIDEKNNPILYNNIIKYTYTENEYDNENASNNRIISAVMPITSIIKMEEMKDKKIEVNGGFRMVQYSTSRVKPNYDKSKPFEILINGKYNDNYEYHWSAVGTINSGISSKDLIKIEDKELQDNLCNFRPSYQYSGLCVNNAAQCIIIDKFSEDSNVCAVVTIPIYFFVNQYGLANINNWDGATIQLNDKGGYILSPQIGAGKKDIDNGFTGVLMGEVKEPMRTNSDIGLLGYYHGQRSFFVDSETGGAIFGRGTSGSIVIDPSLETNAFIYGGNYFKSEYHKENGFLDIDRIREEQIVDINDLKNVGDTGMLIDFTNSKIDYANGNFSVNSEGHLTCNAGVIGGWEITANTIHTRKTIFTSDEKADIEKNYTATLYGNDGTNRFGDYTNLVSDAESDKELNAQNSITQNNNSFLDIRNFINVHANKDKPYQRLTYDIYARVADNNNNNKSLERYTGSNNQQEQEYSLVSIVPYYEDKEIVYNTNKEQYGYYDETSQDWKEVKYYDNDNKITIKYFAYFDAEEQDVYSLLNSSEQNKKLDLFQKGAEEYLTQEEVITTFSILYNGNMLAHNAQFGLAIENPIYLYPESPKSSIFSSSFNINDNGKEYEMKDINSLNDFKIKTKNLGYYIGHDGLFIRNGINSITIGDNGSKINIITTSAKEVFEIYKQDSKTNKVISINGDGSINGNFKININNNISGSVITKINNEEGKTQIDLNKIKFYKGCIKKEWISSNFTISSVDHAKNADYAKYANTISGSINANQINGVDNSYTDLKKWLRAMIKNSAWGLPLQQ